MYSEARCARFVRRDYCEDVVVSLFTADASLSLTTLHTLVAIASPSPISSIDISLIVFQAVHPFSHHNYYTCVRLVVLLTIVDAMNSMEHRKGGGLVSWLVVTTR
ncbi:hypothetical protein AC1031_021943 [Aphanomyces cochlioides]|nr:hypothetical protein AC1031_021943 [Aphanomyces cochlioides]